MKAVLVCGGRDYNNKDRVYEILDILHGREPIDLIIEGGAHGADRLARDWALDRGVQPVTFHANWHKFKAPAGPMRNKAMLSLNPASVVAFPGGAGTKNMVGLAVDQEIPVWKIADV
jgi:predicted Rossmann-fold nucleotide-binding protein